MTWVVNGSEELDAKSEYRLVVGLCVFSSILMVAAVATRCYVRRKKFGLDDVLVVLGAGPALVYNAFAIVQTKYGLGLPLADRPAADKETYTFYNYVGRPFLMTSLTCFKVALCITYLRMIDRTSYRTYRITVFVYIGLLIAFGLFGIGFNVFNCTPMAKNIHPSIPGSCLSYAPWNLWTWSLNSVLDVAVFLLPIPLFMKMSIDFKLRLELSILFSLSLITTVICIFKTCQIPRIAWGDGNSTQFVYLSALEVNAGLIISCLPHLKPLYNWGKTCSSRSHSRSTKSKSYRMDRLPFRSKTETEVKVHRHRNESETEILRPGITKVTHISVEHSPDGSTAGDNQRMT
ncbi:hypothetical protein PFICI_11630 [Pestalotiopsis fici W106-1]|uniref:Rhodopsin domain-containing protein n=1 Tax=Pestalotiopsis fici (strain W106-1 / CGMCC3.15140) TaxID=1229662 RepID=W3WQX9_PESFW|nr:uncharacterized protein PFICI_11630 [Pestalotiopsis fici W106-1]ETS76243.1 hypothetical protein PFICI_11630 [Pestalotiopsis fici W106-1]